MRNYLNLKKERRVRKNMRKTVLTFLIFAFLLLVLALFSSTFSAPPPIKRPMELKSATIEGASPETVDPAWCYDTASAELIFNVYETLIFFNGEHVDQFLPQLATEWTVENITGTVSPDGLSWYYRYTFKIRPNVQWHDSIYGNVTPADVEYSFERGMVQDRDGGPQWMIYEPLLNTWGAKGLGDIGNATNPGPDVALVGKMIDHAVASNDTHVWFNLAFPNVYPPFMQILAKTCSSILCKAWINNYVIDTLLRPDWSGDWMAGGGDHTEWINYHDPEISPLDLDSSPVMMGSGPFSFGTLDYSGQYWSVNRFVNYWRGWPADWPAPSGLSPAGYVDRVEVTWAYNWEQRSAMFLNGDVDFCAVPRMYKDTVLNKDGIRCIWPLPTLAVDALFYTFDIDPTTPYGPINDYGVFSSDAIPRDFFGNPTWGIHVRKAFSYAFDYDTYLSVAFLGYEAIHPATAIIPGLLYYDPSVKGYEYNVTAAEEEFKKVPGLWDTGFNITLVYDTDSTPKTVAANLLKTTLENLNPGLFSVTVTSCNWRSYVRAIQEHKLPIFIIGWQADFADPHNFVYPFYYTYGTFAYWQGYSNPVMDELIERGIATPDGPERAAIYHDIQVLAVEDVPSTTIDQAVGRHFERDWVVGWYYNVLYGGCYWTGDGANYFYPLWKQYYIPHALLDMSTQPTSSLLPVDVNYDGVVNFLDVDAGERAFGSFYGPPIHSRWNFRCDIDNDRKIDTKDLAKIARYCGEGDPKLVHGGDVYLVAEPSKTIVGIGYNVSVAVKINNAVNFAGYEIRMLYNASLLELVSWKIEPIPIWGMTSSYDFQKKISDKSCTGSACWIKWLSTGSPFSGNATLVTFTFRGLTKGNATLDISTSTLATGPPLQTTPYNPINGNVTVAMIGDISSAPNPGFPDGKVDMADVGLVAKGFGANLVTDPASSKYGQYWHIIPCNKCPHSPNCDINGDGKIDMKDVGTVARHFGEKDP